MKKVIFVWIVVLAVCVFLAIHFCFPTKARADESTIYYQKQAIIFLCDDNEELSQTLDDLVGINVTSPKMETIVLPPSYFFRLIKEVVVDGKWEDDYDVILEDLLRKNNQLKSTLAQRTFKAERVK